MTTGTKPPSGPATVRTGSVHATDAALTTWLHKLWHADEPPQRIEVWQMFNPRVSVRGQLIFHIDFKPNSKYSAEDANRLANEIRAVAQDDCNAAERKSYYEIQVIDHNRGAAPLVRRLGPLEPVLAYLTKPGDDHERDADDELPGPRTVTERYNERMMRHLEQKENSLNRVLGDTLLMMRDHIVEQRTWIASMMSQNIQFHGELQNALDRRKERELSGAWTELKVGMARDALRSGRNVLLGLFGSAAAEPAKQVNMTAATAVASAVVKKIGRSVERSLIDGFLTDCEQLGLLPQLFGEWNEQGPLADKPGIFTPAQFAVLIRVRDGELPPEAVDEIIPGFGGKHEISFEQIARAQPLIPDGIGQALIELKTLREQKRTSTSHAQPAA